MPVKITRIVVTGHTLEYGAVIPPKPAGTPGGHRTFAQISMGARLVHRSLTNATAIQASPEKAESDPSQPGQEPPNDTGPETKIDRLGPGQAFSGSAGLYEMWKMGWFPYRPDDSAVKVETLRIRESRAIHVDAQPAPWTPRQAHPFPSEEEADAATAVYVVFDIAANDTTPFVSGKPGLVLLQLTSSQNPDSPEERQKWLERLITLLESIKRENNDARVVVVAADRFLNAMQLPITSDCSWERFASDCRSAFWPDPSGPAAPEKSVRRFAELADHLIVRHHASAAVHFRYARRGTPSPPLLHYLVRSSHQVSAATGFLTGYNSILGASIFARAIRTEDGEVSDEAIMDGIREGLLRCTKFESVGFFDKDKDEFDLNRIPGLFDGPLKKTIGKLLKEATVRPIPVPVSAPDGHLWCVLDRQIHLHTEKAVAVGIAAKILAAKASDKAGLVIPSLDRALWQVEEMKKILADAGIKTSLNPIVEIPADIWKEFDESVKTAAEIIKEARKIMAKVLDAVTRFEEAAKADKIAKTEAADQAISEASRTDAHTKAAFKKAIEEMATVAAKAERLRAIAAGMVKGLDDTIRTANDAAAQTSAIAAGNRAAEHFAAVLHFAKGSFTKTCLEASKTAKEARDAIAAANPVDKDRNESLRDTATEFGLKIVRCGLTAAVNEWNLPVVRFGKLIIVNRLAFDDVWEIQAAMRSYLETFQLVRRPLCLALFGAPGGGKSFAVKQLAESLRSDHLRKENIFEVNMAQYREPADLAWVFRKVRDVTLQGRVPLVFFDEFDTVRENRAFGWQQTFLAPMQDGRFGVEPNEIVFHHGIFVFVGGVNHSFDMFNGRDRNREFIEAKGPDFISRLVRHLNVLGITPNPEHPDDFTFVIRRAVILRENLWRLQPGLFRDGEEGPAAIDEDVARALLTVPEFRHGVRSLEAIIRTCRLPPDRPRFHWATLPPRSQLDMHVDVAQFFKQRP